MSAYRLFSVGADETLEALLAESATDQQEVTDQLGYQVRRAVEVLIQAIDRADQDRGRALLAGLDGIQNKIDPGEPSDYDLFEHHNGNGKSVKQVPGSLPEALAALEADHKFLLAGGVFTPDVIETWIDYKRNREIDPIRLRPHPYEFYLYYDA